MTRCATLLGQNYQLYLLASCVFFLHTISPLSIPKQPKCLSFFYRLTLLPSSWIHHPLDIVDNLIESLILLLSQIFPFHFWINEFWGPAPKSKQETRQFRPYHQFKMSFLFFFPLAVKFWKADLTFFTSSHSLSCLDFMSVLLTPLLIFRHDVCLLC